MRTVQDWKVGNSNYISVAKYSILYNCDVMFRNGLVEYYISERYMGKISKEDKILIKNLRIEKRWGARSTCRTSFQLVLG